MRILCCESNQCTHTCTQLFWPASTSNTMQVRLTIWLTSGISWDIIVDYQRHLKENYVSSGIKKEGHEQFTTVYMNSSPQFTCSTSIPRAHRFLVTNSFSLPSRNLQCMYTNIIKWMTMKKTRQGHSLSSCHATSVTSMHYWERKCHSEITRLGPEFS